MDIKVWLCVVCLKKVSICLLLYLVGQCRCVCVCMCHRWDICSLSIKINMLKAAWCMRLAHMHTQRLCDIVLVFVCLVSKDPNTPHWTFTADDAITHGGIGGLESLFFICDMYAYVTCCILVLYSIKNAYLLSFLYRMKRAVRCLQCVEWNGELLGKPRKKCQSKLTAEINQGIARENRVSFWPLY